MKNLKLVVILLLGVFIVLQSCKKNKIESKKELTKLEYLKQLTGSNNFVESFDKNDNYIKDSLNAVEYKYYPDENDMSFYQDIIIKDGKVENEDDLALGWWITIESLGTAHVMGTGQHFMLMCDGNPADCANITLFGNEHILF